MQFRFRSIFNRVVPALLIVGMVCSFVGGLSVNRASAQTSDSGNVVSLNLSADQWVQFGHLVDHNLEVGRFVQMTATWTIVDWINWGKLSSALEDNDLANGGDNAAIHRVIARVWGTDASWAYSIVQRESGFDPLATNRSSGACGLFQMLGHEDMFRAAGYGGRCHEAVANIEVAHILFLGSGRSPWNL